MQGPALADFDVPFAVETLRLSPHARLAAVERVEDEDTNAKLPSPVVHIGRPAGRLWPVDAADIAFVGDDRALELVVGDRAAEARDVSFADGPAVPWSEHLPHLRDGTLT